MTYRPIAIDDLRRVHRIAAERFPHKYLDVGLGAIGLFLHDPPKNSGYSVTPKNSITFASIGVDGVHFGSITKGHRINPDSPVVVTIPMDFEEPNFIVGETLHDFLCLGCQKGYWNLGNLACHLEATLVFYAGPTGDFSDERVPGVLRLLVDEFSLQPWHDVHSHFHELQMRFAGMLEVGEANDGLKDCSQ